VTVQLTLFSDFGLRIGLYLACHPGRLVSVEEISRAYSISRFHLVKVVQRLTALGLVEAVRGRGGGLRLGKDPADIRIGDLVRSTEPTMDLVECFDLDTNTCPIAGACGMKGALRRAQSAFVDSLNQNTLADFLPRREKLIALWRRASA
jgi:Rrf2 family transcriptional regulator, nitric oxide-sensitive transcriptional repressor